MQKLLQTSFGLIIFVYVLSVGIGMGMGFIEQQNYVRYRTEYINRAKIVEPERLGIEGTGTKDPSLLEVEANMKRFLPTLNIQTYIEQDNDGDGKPSYGDSVSITIDAYGKGQLGFKKSSKLRAKQGVESNRIRFNSTKKFIIQTR